MLVMTGLVNALCGLNLIFIGRAGSVILIYVVAVLQTFAALRHLKRDTDPSKLENIVFLLLYVVCGSLDLRGIIDILPVIGSAHFVKSQNALDLNTKIEFDYVDSVLRIEEYTEANSLVAELLNFFVGCDNFYFLTEYSEDGVVQGYDTNDDEGKYFTVPSKTI